MKALIKSLALALSLGVVTSATTFAETHPIVRPAVVAYQTGIYTSVDGKLNIALNKEIGGTVDIYLKNAEGKMMYNQHVAKNESKFRVRLDVNELPDGVYQVEVTNGVETTTHQITLSTQQPTTPARVVVVK